MKCPKNHSLPNVINGVQCAPDFCAENVDEWKVPEVSKYEAQKKAKRVRENVALTAAEKTALKNFEKGETGALISEMFAGTGMVDAVKDEAARERTKEIVKVGRAIAKFEARRAVVKTPKNLAPEQAKEYVDKKLDTLLPDAIDRVEYELKFGDEANSLKAAYEVLDRRGYGKRENNPILGAPIVIVQQNASNEPVVYKPGFLTIDSDK